MKNITIGGTMMFGIRLMAAALVTQAAAWATDFNVQTVQFPTDPDSRSYWESTTAVRLPGFTGR